MTNLQIINNINDTYFGVEASVSATDNNKIDLVFNNSLKDDYNSELQFLQIIKEYNLYVFHAYNGFYGYSFEMDRAL